MCARVYRRGMYVSRKRLTDVSLQVQAILGGVIELRNQNVDLVEIQGTVEEVTLDKCRRAAEAVCIMLLLFHPVLLLT
jgi:hypothetical protein